MKKRNLNIILPMVTVAAVLVGVSASSGTGLAAKQGPDHVRRDVGSDIAAFQSPGDRPSASEYARLRKLAHAPKLDIDNAAPTDSELASIDEARVLSNDPTVGRIVAVPAADGSGLCFSQDLPVRFGVSNVSGCNGRIDEDGLLMQYGRVEGVGWTVFGLAADDVDSVTVTTASGGTTSVPVTGNGFVWTSSDDLDVPITVTSHEGDTAVELDLPPQQ